MGGNPFKLSRNEPAGSFNLDGWVNVEMPEAERDRVHGKGLERVSELAVQKEERPQRAADSGPTLDRVFAIAFRESDRTASEESLRRTLDVDLHGAMPEEFKELEKRRLFACNALHDLDSRTGNELVEVADAVESGEDWSTVRQGEDGTRIEMTRALLNDAITAQENYAKELENCAKLLESRGDYERAEALRQLGLRTRARAEAIAALPEKLRTASEGLDEADPDDEKLLDRRGFTDIIYSEEAKKSGLLDRMGDVPDDASPDGDFYRDGGTDALHRAYSSLRKTYGAGDGVVSRKDVALASARNLADGVKLPKSLLRTLKRIEIIRCKLGFELNCLPEDYWELDFSALARVLDKSFLKFKAAMNRYIDACADPENADVEAARRDLENAVSNDKKTGVDDYLDLTRKVCNGFKGLYRILVANRWNGEEEDEMSELFSKLNLTFYGRLSVRELTNLIGPKTDKTTVELSQDDLSELMEGTRHLSSRVEAEIWGAKGLHDPELDGFELRKVERLSVGSFNDVKLCKFVSKDGTRKIRRVFRPDSGASRSVQSGAIAKFLSKSNDVSGFSFNHASGVVAAHLGCEDVFPKTTFGTLDGQPGMFLEYVGGKDGDYFGDNPDNRSNGDPFPVRNDVDAAGDVARGLNRLQWLDFLTGQVDRHMRNLKIGKDKNGHVQVKGIDNDECFPDQSIGNGLLVFDSRQEAEKGLARFGLPEKVKPEELDNLRARNLPQRLANHLNGKFVVDINRLSSLKNRLMIVYYHKNFGMPDHIDWELMEMLKAVDPEAYAADLRAAGLTEKQVFAAVARLQYVLAAIDELSADQIYDEDDWHDRDRLDALDGDATQNALEDEIRSYNREQQRKHRWSSESTIRKKQISAPLAHATVNARLNYYKRTKFHRYMFGA